MASPRSMYIEPGDTVLVVIDPSQQKDWVPAMVERTGDNRQIVATAFINGNAYHLEGCRHQEDPWWQSEGALAIAHQEGIGMWKYRRKQYDIAELHAVVASLTASISSTRKSKAAVN